KITGVAHLDPEPEGDPGLLGKRLGLINGSSWTTTWSNYFGRLYAPGAHLINVGNEAVQLNFMQAHQAGQPTPPQSNIDAFVRYARDLVELANVDAIMITCSTMNRAYPAVQDAVDVPVVSIDEPMMRRAVEKGGRVLVIATHGPTVASTQKLLTETAARLDREVAFAGETVEAAWHKLATGDVKGHNHILADVIRAHLRQEEIGCVVLAQLSMTVLLFSYPDPVKEFGAPVFTSGQCGFEHMAALLKGEVMA
ncbi:MAG: aspartate/glutamate racemase family protein, partial [Chloroflexi bacterium]|nr:aspartate/glutamate racemase family protein [Chloroflexota bacterium]